jgi:hypothetical protein
VKTSHCIQAEHNAIKERVEFFMLETRRHEEWLGLLTGECVECGSTLSLQCCAICAEPCATSDALPWGKKEDETVAHFSCVARAMLAKHRTKFVIVTGKATAREFARNDNTNQEGANQ